MLSQLSKGVLFLSSFSPLLVVFFLLDYWGSAWSAWFCLALAVASWIGLATLVSVLNSIATTPLVAKKADRKDQEILTYLAANLLPFLSIDPKDGKEIAASLIFVGLIAIFFIRGEIYYTNPVLALFDRRILALETDNQTVYLITRRRNIARNTEVHAVQISDHVMWEKGNK